MTALPAHRIDTAPRILYTLSYMAIVTRIQPFTLWRNVGFGLLCLVFGLWGAYDYWIKIPLLEEDSSKYEVTKEIVSNLEKSAEKTPLTVPEIKQRDEAKNTLTEIRARYNNTVPAKPAAYDRPMQLWLYIIGCGVLGVPMFAWPIIRTRMKPYRLEDDGTLRTPTTTIPESEIADIDMTRWCSPTGDRRSTWTAKLLLKNGKQILLDDHDNKNMHLIIGAIAHRLHPKLWTAKAKRIEQPSDNSATDSQPANTAAKKT